MKGEAQLLRRTIAPRDGLAQRFERVEQLAPDLQFVINPGGTDFPHALVLGFEAGFTF